MQTVDFAPPSSDATLLVCPGCRCRYRPARKRVPVAAWILMPAVAVSALVAAALPAAAGGWAINAVSRDMSTAVTIGMAIGGAVALAATGWLMAGAAWVLIRLYGARNLQPVTDYACPRCGEVA